MNPPLPLPLDYPVFCEAGALDGIGHVVATQAPAHRVAVISDETVAAHHAPQVLAQLRTVMPADRVRLLTIPPGEQEKTRKRWSILTDELLAWGAGRDTTIIALGGGVIGDLAGFVAATYMRGIPVIQVPTSLLAMVDASVGGKTGVDTAAGKNLVGAFHDPAAVVIDPLVLTSLPPAVLRSGLAEMLKHGVIADARYFDALQQALPSLRADGARSPHFAPLIADSVRIKAAIVAADHREGGKRQILNFGHTIGHAIEKGQQYALLHGDAVAIGMVIESRIAERAGVTDASLSAIMADAVRAAGLPSALPLGTNLAQLLVDTHGDKKARGGVGRYALPQAIGVMGSWNGSWSVAVPDTLVRAALAEHAATVA
ncbi:MAG: 3-dehydroquinate synthase [Gemmatimonas sp.]|uniref:3-dehydroquinate synthase n=1 Tax=Gemmatimonas sp. TaxID=1962908 RepID=UPI00391FA4C5|nr:3-dehydroquinate synthase [Gemmatimonadota bacterium]